MDSAQPFPLPAQVLQQKIPHKQTSRLWLRPFVGQALTFNRSVGTSMQTWLLTSTLGRDSISNASSKELRHYVHADRPLVVHMPRAKTMGADTRGNLQTVPRYRKEVRHEFKHYIFGC